jgi:hypothetical protein
LVIDGHCYSAAPVLDTTMIPIRGFKNRRCFGRFTITRLVPSLNIILAEQV